MIIELGDTMCPSSHEEYPTHEDSRIVAFNHRERNRFEEKVKKLIKIELTLL